MRPLLLILLVVAATPAFGASIAGRITSAGTGVAGMEVRLWAQTAKGFSFEPPNGQVVTTNASGDYTISNIAAGTYRLDTRMSMVLTANYGDRWLDAAAPTGNGYVPAAADDIVLVATDALTGINIAVDVNGGLEGRTIGTAAAAPLGGLFVRLEALSDFRVHHNDISKTTPASRLGETSFRGLPPQDYRLVVHDPNYTRGDVVGPTFALTANTNATGGDITVALAPADPNEPNNQADAGTLVDVAAIRMMPAQPLTGTGAIGPRNSGDVDFYCWDSLAGERYLISAVGTFGTLPDGGVRESPWVDPVLSFWRDGNKVAEDDDSGPLGFDAHLDTGVVAAGRVCAAVTTFGDTMWVGQNQGSAGPYLVRLEMGNRAPSITATYNSLPTPTAPTPLMMDEGNTVTISVSFSDPESNTLTSSWELTDSQMRVVGTGTFNGSTGTVTYSASQSAARRSPYTLRLRTADAEFTTNKTVLLEVRGTNVPPRVPMPVSPDAGAIVTNSRPPLTCLESADDDADPLTYDFQIAWVDGGALLQTGSVQGNDAGIEPDGGVFGLVAFVPTSLPENSRLLWRVRAFDGNIINGYSSWSDDQSFVVDVTNEAPPAPTLLKPTDGEALMVRRPTLEAITPVDPEGDAVSFIFEIARDAAFTQLAVISPQVPATAGSTTTSWTVGQDLDWGGRYYAHAIAVDARGARSQPGNVNAFSIQGNSAPMVPVPGAPFAAGLCADQIFTTPPTSIAIPPILDMEQDPVIVEVQLAKGDDSQYAMPLFRADVMANVMSATSVSLESVKFEEDQKYRVRMRSKDGRNVTEWVECSFTLDARMGNNTGGGGATNLVTKKPCGCSMSEAGLLLLALPVLRLRRRRS